MDGMSSRIMQVGLEGYRKEQGVLSNLLSFLHMPNLNDILSLFPERRLKKWARCSLRTLTHFPDGLGKVRVIAIADWATQHSLKVLHNILIANLRRTVTDFTYDQNRSLLVFQE